MARRKRFTEGLMLRLLPGTLARLTAVAAPLEALADVARIAIERELERREAAAARRSAKDDPPR